MANGIATKAAFKIESQSYRQAATPGAGDQIYFTGESVSPSAGLKRVLASADVQNADILKQSERASGTISIEPRYNDIALLFSALGFSHSASPIDNGDSPNSYRHLVEPDPDIADRTENIFDSDNPSGELIRRGTLAVDKGVDIWEYLSMQVSGFDLSITPERVTLNFPAVAPELNLNSQENNDSSSWSLPGGNQIVFEDCQVYLKPLFAHVITSANDNIQVSTSLTENMTIEHGVYTPEELAKRVERGLQALTIPGASDFTVTWDASEQKYTFTCSQNFDFTENELASEMGFDDEQTPDTTQISLSAVTIGQMSAFDSDDLICSDGISLSFKRRMVSKTETDNGTVISQPFSTDFNLSGSIRNPRYESGSKDFLSGVNRLVSYSLQIKFTGKPISLSNNEEFNIMIPAIKFRSGAASVSGPGSIPVNLSFEAVDAEKIDLLNFWNESYFIRSMKSFGDDLTAVAIFEGKLHFANLNGSDTEIYRLDLDGTVTQIGSNLSNNTIYCMHEYAGKLYMAGAESSIRVWDGSTITVSNSTSDVGSFVDMAVYDGRLFVTHLDEGKVYEFDGSTWSISRTVSNEAMALQVVNGLLYLSANTSDATPNAYIDSYDGTSWTGLYEIGSYDAGTWAPLTRHNGNIYLGADDEFARIIDGSWTKVTGLAGIDIRFMLSYMGHLFLLEDDNDADIGVYDEPSATYTSLGTDLGDLRTSELVSKPVYYRGRWVIVNRDDAPLYLAKVPRFYIEIQNTVSTNPLT